MNEESNGVGTASPSASQVTQNTNLPVNGGQPMAQTLNNALANQKQKVAN